MRRILFAALSTVLFIACSGNAPEHVDVVPQPQKAILHSGSCKYSPEEINAVLDTTLAPESYVLSVKRSGITVRYADRSGLLYAGYTLEQLADRRGRVRCCEIEDAPRFSYRGMHMDCSRHFFTVEEVKTYIDILSFHKLNVLHWHLTDDQGWRIEIKKYPRLTTVGSIRKETIIRKGPDFDGTPYGGFYTQDEIRDVVAYAASKGITIVPEIDLPGHMIAALAAYPELGCTSGPYEVWTRWGIAEDALCAGNEKVYTFLEDVLTEVMQLFPGKMIHIGGDECKKDRWHHCPKCQAKIRKLGLKSDDKYSEEQYLQAYLMARVQNFIESHGRRVIGWDEILEGNPSRNAIVMSWRGTEGGEAAIARGMDAIMTANKFLYFDYYQSKDKDNEPFAIGGYVPVKLVYDYEPMEGVIGLQANLWTEYIPTAEQLQYMLLPRLAALCETQWAPSASKDYALFLKTMAHVRTLYDARGWNYAKHIFAPDYTYGDPAPIKHNGQGREVAMLTMPHPKYTGNAPAELFDGVLGDGQWRSGAWLGYRDAPLDVVIKMDRKKVKSVSVNALVDKGAYIFAPVAFSLEVSSDGENYTEVIREEYSVDGEQAKDDIRTYTLTPEKAIRAEYLRVRMENVTEIPEWHAGAGRPAFLFVDEIIVR